MTEPERKVIRVAGSDAETFLQGLVSNDVNKLSNGLVYAALLTPQGKYLADFFLVPDEAAILIDVAEPLANGLIQRLSMYKLRADVTVEMTDIAVARGLGDAPAGAYSDPRHESLGWRGYAGQTSDPDVDWTGLNVAACIPESGIELTPDSYILESGFERLNGVDFKKGCYVGQEVTARMKHKTELRKGLTRVAIDGSAPVGTEITANGKAAGQLFRQADGYAIAYLRFDRAGHDMLAESAKVHFD